MTLKFPDVNWWRGFTAGALALDIVVSFVERPGSSTLRVVDKLVGAVCAVFIFLLYWVRRS